MLCAVECNKCAAIALGFVSIKWVKCWSLSVPTRQNLNICIPMQCQWISSHTCMKCFRMLWEHGSVFYANSLVN